jgi:hypothetical protein
LFGVKNPHFEPLNPAWNHPHPETV